MDKPTTIRVKDPLSRRTLFAFDPAAQIVTVTHRGITTDVDLRKLTRDPDDQTAVVSKPASRPVAPAPKGR